MSRPRTAGKIPESMAQNSMQIKFLSEPSQRVILLLALLFFTLQAWLFQRSLNGAHSPVLTDFHDYYIVMGLALDGRAGDAFSWPMLKAEQITQTGSWAFMSWAYPPPFTMLLAPLGLLPIGLAYFVFTVISWLLFQSALWRLVGKATAPALFITLPALLINAKCGQNGFLIAGIIGWSLVAIRERSSTSGWWLGAMIIKPHLAAGIGLLALFERQWGAVWRAAMAASLLCITATLAFGLPIWAAFQTGTATTSTALWQGLFPLERMTSVFAALNRFGLQLGFALTIHVISVVAFVSAFIVAARSHLDRDLFLAMGACVTLLIGPYNYDYDMVTLTLPIGLMLPYFVARAKVHEFVALIFLSWVALSNYLWIGLRQIWYGVPKIEASMQLWTISPIALAFMAFLAFLVCTVVPRPAPAVPSGALARAYLRSGGKFPA